MESGKMEKGSPPGKPGRRAAYPFVRTMAALFASAILFIVVGAVVQIESFELGTLIVEYGIVLAPVFILGSLWRVDMKSALRLKGLRVSSAVKILLLAVCCIPIIIPLNLVPSLILESMGKSMPDAMPYPDSVQSLIVMLLVAAVTPAICEELMFRGMIMSAFEGRTGKVYGVVLSAVIFGMFHFNPVNLLGPVALGILFGYLVYLTDSILAGVIAHMTNNGVALIMAYASRSYAGAEQAGAIMENTLPSNGVEGAMLAVSMAIVVGIFAFPAIALLRSIRSDYSRNDVGDMLSKPDLGDFEIVGRTDDTLVLSPKRDSGSFRKGAMYRLGEDRASQMGLRRVKMVFGENDRRLGGIGTMVPVILFAAAYAAISALIIWSL